MSDILGALKNQIDRWIAKFPPERKQSAVLPVLMLVQENNGGWLNQALLQAVADYLDMPYIAVHEVAAFYSLYELKPVGKYKIAVCTNVSCMLSGADDIVKKLQEKLAIRFNQTTPDKKFTLKETECLGACVGAPVVYLNKRYYENMTPEKIDSLLDNLS